jgi:hypothetical protein
MRTEFKWSCNNSLDIWLPLVLKYYALVQSQIRHKVIHRDLKIVLVESSAHAHKQNRTSAKPMSGSFRLVLIGLILMEGSRTNCWEHPTQ